jgi:hypothetical protein
MLPRCDSGLKPTRLRASVLRGGRHLIEGGYDGGIRLTAARHRTNLPPVCLVCSGMVSEAHNSP